MTLVVFVIAPAQAATPKVVGTVGPAFTIKLTSAGKKATKLKAGKYTFVVTDSSKTQNFHLKGRGVNKKTSVVGLGRSTWTLDLKKGSYTYVSDTRGSKARSLRIT